MTEVKNSRNKGLRKDPYGRSISLDRYISLDRSIRLTQTFNKKKIILFDLLELKYYTIYFLLYKLKAKLHFFEIASNFDRPFRSTRVQFRVPTSAYLPFPQIQHTTLVEA